jgi:predicted DCC family thiol-disulfide oxidoreductase YuxK
MTVRAEVGAAPVLLYDGRCAMCSGVVRDILRHDRRGSLRFASIASPFAERVVARHPELRGIDSIVWVDLATERVFTRSAAIARVASYLGGCWRLASVLLIVPQAIRDWGYDLIARHRHLLAGNAVRCLVPPPDMRHRFLDGE